MASRGAQEVGAVVTVAINRRSTWSWRREDRLCRSREVATSTEEDFEARPSGHMDDRERVRDFGDVRQTEVEEEARPHLLERGRRGLHGEANEISSMGGTRQDVDRYDTDRSLAEAFDPRRHGDGKVIQETWGSIEDRSIPMHEDAHNRDRSSCNVQEIKQGIHLSSNDIDTGASDDN
mmetsp:Transcript_9110/g.20139  ORF Transcript_9110/g.20139 Transcript_9110/m.20139 type:complete len:178 (-) Transcript_9110:265-798(-)